MASRSEKSEVASFVPPPSPGVLTDFSAVHCPECEWQPQASARWRCGCGHSWNVFETRGVCPLCGAKEPETTCLSCEAKSSHDDWYASGEAEDVDDEDDDDAEDEDDGEEVSSRPAHSAFMQPLTPSSELARIVGAGPITRVAVTERVWRYIREHGLQDQKNPRMINADEALRAVLGADQVNLFELTGHVMRHLS